ncbi:MAG: type II toxin-antitoxin system HicB family antitoxin [Verrucomicrobiales bacterium]|jgi:predicted RNase H-like HicB family nuclease|nr:type II toxin-antitoxin system HicB family antitoxin [Verrucomicrobiales bacterium]
MKRYTYTVEVHPADSDETGYWVSVPALPGCFTQAETYEEALSNAEEAIAGYLEALVKAGQPIPLEAEPPRRVAIGVGINVAVPS